MSQMENVFYHQYFIFYQQYPNIIILFYQHFKFSCSSRDHAHGIIFFYQSFMDEKEPIYPGSNVSRSESLLIGLALIFLHLMH